MRRVLLFGLAGAAFAVPAHAAAATPASGAANARLALHTLGDRGGSVEVGGRVMAVGRLRPFVPGQSVRVWLTRNGKTIQSKKLAVRQVHRKNVGAFHLRSKHLIAPGRYAFRAKHHQTPAQRYANDASQRFHISYPDLDQGDRGHYVSLFADLLRAQGYFTRAHSVYGSDLGLAVLAYRKVNGMPRTYDATADMFKTLADGRGGFSLRYPGAGRHVEVDISRQVMVFADHGRAVDIFPVSTGAPATPTIRGHYQFYTRTPGYNSEGMYYSVYFHTGYATHGYNPVPTYPASHGCVRNPIPDSIFIYDWIQLGESIYLY